MALESATYINGLNSANPPAADPAAQADDHLRLIKGALLATFPNITGAVSSTQLQLNTSLVPTGGIMLWYGSTGSVPTGYGLCDGSTYTKSDASGSITAPDLRDRFVLGQGPLHAVGTTGGNSSATGVSDASSSAVTATVDSQGAHTHGGSAGSTVLDISQIPSHSHSGGFTAGSAIGSTTGATYFVGSANSTGSIGGGLGHTHTIGSDGAHTHTVTVTSGTHVHSTTISTVPPYLALAYIMKL